MTYSALQLLLQGYLNLDWSDDYPDVWAGVDDFLAQEPSASNLPDEIDEVLARRGDEIRRIIIEDLDSGYLPEADGMTVEAWLGKVAARARRVMGESDQ